MWRPHLDRDRHREQRARPALRDEGEVARVVALAHGVFLDRLHHRVGKDLHGAHGRLLDGHAQRLCRPVCERPPGQVPVERHAAAEKVFGEQPAEVDHRVRRRRLRAPAAVGRRTRHRAGRARPDAVDPARIHVGDGAAAGADRVDVDHRDHRLVRADPRVEQMLHAQAPVLRETDVRRRAADVERDHVVVAGLLAGPDASDDPGHRAGHEHGDRPLDGGLRRGHARGRRHQVEARAHAELAQLLLRAARRTTRPSARCTRSGPRSRSARTPGTAAPPRTRRRGTPRGTPRARSRPPAARARGSGTRTESTRRPRRPGPPSGHGRAAAPRPRRAGRGPSRRRRCARRRSGGGGAERRGSAATGDPGSSRS